MGIYEHTDIKRHMLDFQRLYLHYLQLKQRKPFVVQDASHQALLDIIATKSEESGEPVAGPADRQVTSRESLSQGYLVNLRQESFDSIGLLAVDLLVRSSASKYRPRPDVDKSYIRRLLQAVHQSILSILK